MSERLNTGWHALLITIGVATIFAGMFAMKPAPVVPAPPVESAAPSASESAAPRRQPAPGELTYCPGPTCAVEETARRYCEAELRGSFAAEPDFTCARDDGVHRIVCDDIADEHQCGHMSHSDLD